MLRSIECWYFQVKIVGFSLDAENWGIYDPGCACLAGLVVEEGIRSFLWRWIFGVQF